MKTIKCAVYTDIHHHEYTNGLTGDDVLAIEHQFNELIARPDIDFWMFLGDRFASRNPLDISRYNADSALKEHAKHGKPGALLPGNHDQRYKNANRGHTMWTASVFQENLFSNIHTFDTPSTKVINVAGQDVAIHGIPAGMEIPDFKKVKNAWNICIFHGMISGSKYANGITSDEGISSAALDDSKFDIVLCGDNHTRQQLNFKNTLGYYVGAPMQHNIGDIGAPRGFAIVTFSDAGINVEFIESKVPKFTKTRFEIKDMTDIITIVEQNTNLFKGNINDVTLSGPSDVMEHMDPHQIAAKLTNLAGARKTNIHISYQRSYGNVSTTTPKTDIEEWQSYASANFDSTLDLDKLKSIGEYYISTITS